MSSIHCLVGHAFVPEKVVSFVVEAIIMRNGGFAALAGGDAGLNIALDQCVAELVSIIPAICQQGPCLGQ